MTLERKVYFAQMNLEFKQNYAMKKGAHWWCWNMVKNNIC